jgi:hypothetical protein
MARFVVRRDLLLVSHELIPPLGEEVAASSFFVASRRDPSKPEP